MTSKVPTYRLLGKSGLRVSPLALGTMGWGDSWKQTFNLSTSEAEAEKILLRYFELGGNFIDTANNYSTGESETIIGNILERNKEKYPRHSYVVATKYSLPDDIFNHTKGPNASGNHKKNLIRSIDDSLRRLKLDYVDILYVHFWDFTMKPEDVMKILEDTVIKTGKALYLAVSDTPAWIVSKANTIAEHRGWSQFVAYQGLYSLINRDIEQEIVPCCLDSNIGIVPWGVLGSGKLTGRTLRPTSEEQVSTVGESQRKYTMTDEEFDIQDKVIEVAKELGVTPSQVVVNWNVNAKGITAPLIAPRTVEQLEDLFASLDFTLTEEQKKKLEEATKNKPARIFPAAMIGVGDDPSFAYGVPGTPRLFNIEMQRK